MQPDQIQQVIMGNVLQAAVGQAPARQAGIGAGIPVGAGAITVNKVCGSGMRAIMYAANDIRCGDYDIAIAGGMESMSNAPYALTQARTGYRMGNGKMIDVMIHDGLWDPYGDKHMGNCAEACAAKYTFTREQQDDFSRESYRRAQEAMKTGKFKKEIAVVEVPGKKGTSVIIDDEEPFAAPLEKMRTLKPAFQKDGGTVTAANCVEDQRRRRGAGRDVGYVRVEEQAEADRADRRALDRTRRSRSGSRPRRAKRSSSCSSARR